MLTENKTPTQILEYLKSLSPSGVELEFISLSSYTFDKTQEGGKARSGLEDMLKTLVSLVDENKEVDFVQALLNNFLSHYHETIVAEVELVQMVRRLKDKLEGQFKQAEDLLNGSLCMTQYFSALNTY